MAEFEVNRIGGGGAPALTDAASEVRGHGTHAGDRKLKAPPIPTNWPIWKERQLAALIYAVAARNGENGHNADCMTDARQTARRALAIASSLTFPYDEARVEEIGDIALGGRPDPHGLKIVLGGRVLHLAAANHPLEAPKLHEWLAVWSGLLGNGSSQWAARYEQGLALAGRKPTKSR